MDKKIYPSVEAIKPDCKYCKHEEVLDDGYSLCPFAQKNSQPTTTMCEYYEFDLNKYIYNLAE